MALRKNYASEKDYRNHLKNLKAVGDAVRKKIVNAIALDMNSGFIKVPNKKTIKKK